MTGNPLLALKALGQQVWLDNLSRTLLQEGGLQRLIDADGIDGVTSNPAIFEKAIATSPYYQSDRQALLGSSLSAEGIYEALVIPDIQAACDLFLPSFRGSAGERGWVSLEVSPHLAHDTAGTVAAAHRLAGLVGRPNLFIKVPGTPAGLAAFEQLTAAGLPVNVTLIFSLAQYVAVAHAYLRGARRWLESDGAAGQLRSVASVFLSRVDTLVDRRLDAIQPPVVALNGQAGVALAKSCYVRYREMFHGPAFAALRQAGVQAQTPLWASTGNKNPDASDVRYLEPLIGPETISTSPDATLAAFRDHGQATATLLLGVDEAQAHSERLTELGIDLAEIGETLQDDGVRLFVDAYDKIMDGLGREA